MTLKYLAALSAWVAISLTGGIALAQDEPEMSDAQYCEMEAEEAGMMNESDIRDYVKQCLEEIRLQDEAHAPEHDSDEGNATNWE
ncbi:MAG: hypothetical protein ABW157_15240 [Candidatus Thiodiazotropha sp. LLP2]|nr:hypothetical protein [Candidatus Thiodiazotropha lotti]MCW4216805.1 hypothetical protein [Candidatus Thiodiazotropha lotti]